MEAGKASGLRNYAATEERQDEARLVLDSPEPAGKLEDLHDRAFKWGTVTNTLLDSVAVQGELAAAHARIN